MNFDPQKYFIGLIDLFSIWLPGAILTLIVAQETGIPGNWPPSGTSQWIGILLLSYIVGHFAFAVGSLLDYWIYDRLRCGTRDRQIEVLAAGGRASSPLVRSLARRFFSKHDEPLRHALRLRDEHLDPVDGRRAINAYQWCKARLALKHSGALSEVDRWEADSKFFRSLCAVILLLGLWRLIWLACVAAVDLLDVEEVLGVTSPVIDPWNTLFVVLAGAATLLFALWRYVERRTKAVTQAYWLVLAASERGEPARASQSPAHAATHAGGVVLRNMRGSIEHLQVRTSENWRETVEAWRRGEALPEEKWVLPKGHIEPGETPERAATREVLEEAVVWARIRDELGLFRFVREGQQHRVLYYVMEFQGSAYTPRPDYHRWLGPRRLGKDPEKARWCPLADVEALPPESQDAVRAADAYLPV